MNSMIRCVTFSKHMFGNWYGLIIGIVEDKMFSLSFCAKDTMLGVCQGVAIQVFWVFFILLCFWKSVLVGCLGVLGVAIECISWVTEVKRYDRLLSYLNGELRICESMVFCFSDQPTLFSIICFFKVMFNSRIPGENYPLSMIRQKHLDQSTNQRLATGKSCPKSSVLPSYIFLHNF